MSNKKTTGAGSKQFNRITIRHNDGTVDYYRRYGTDDILYRLADFEDEGLSPEEVHKRLEWLKEYVKAEMDDRLIKLPCPFGTMIYRIIEKHIPRTVMHHGSDRPKYKYIQKGKFTKSNALKIMEKFGKTVFLTRTDAQTALNMLEGNGNA